MSLYEFGSVFFYAYSSIDPWAIHRGSGSPYRPVISRKAGGNRTIETGVPRAFSVCKHWKTFVISPSIHRPLRQLGDKVEISITLGLWRGGNELSSSCPLQAASSKLLTSCVLRAVVTCEIQLFQNYFRGLLQLMNSFQHVQCCWSNFEIISELCQRAAEIILFQFQTWLHVK